MKWSLAEALVRFSVCVLGAVGCSDGDGGGQSDAGAGGDTGGATGGTGGATGGTGGTGGATGGTGGTGGTPSETITFSGVATSNTPPGGDHPTSWAFDQNIEGMDVCLLENGECSHTDAAGAYRLETVPADAEVMLVLTHPDYLGRMLLQYVTGAVDREQNLYLTSTAHMTAYLASSGCGGVPEAGTGTLFIGAPPGAQVVVTPAPPMAPVYAGVDGLFDAALSAIPADTPATLAGAVTCGVPPGTYEIDVVGAPENCHMIEGWPSVDHDVRIVVEADTHSIFNWVCDE